MGESVVDHRSSWVRKVATSRGEFYVKTYEYVGWGDRLRNWGKWTAPWRSSRAARECAALLWMRQHNLAAPQPLACFESRRFGFLTRAIVLTEAFAGQRCDYLLAEATPEQRLRLTAAIKDWVHAAHRLGFRDRNLDLRNLIARDADDRITIAKIDSPRFRLITPGEPTDRLAQADWQRLLPQLAPFAAGPTA